MDQCLHIAPMMGWTDRAGRFLMSCLSPRLRLWTEMIAAPALIHGDAARILGEDELAASSVLQLGGADPAILARAAKIGEARGYSEINLNAGCPSCRVSAGGFGAALMLEPERAARCVAAIAEAVSIPVSVKCRLGVDEQDPEVILPDFIHRLAQAGACRFVVHARKAWLKGLNPKQNRNVPPLDYGLVYRLKARFSRVEIILNGGIENLENAARHLHYVDGVMIGRAAFRDPMMLADPNNASKSRGEIFRLLADYAARHNVPRARLVRLASGLWRGQRGAAQFRRALHDHEDHESLLAAAERLAA